VRLIRWLLLALLLLAAVWEPESEAVPCYSADDCSNPQGYFDGGSL